METLSAPAIILASASPRRREMLRLLGLTFQCVVTDIPEQPLPAENPTDYVRRVAADKAYAALRAPSTGNADCLIIAGDTAVILEDAILGKPATHEDARDMLLRLSGRTHQVVTGVCLLRRRAGIIDAERLFSVSTDVLFKTLSPAEVDAYVRTGDPMDKAGAYGIQSGAAHMIREIHGSYTNVVGMPMTELHEALQALGAC